MCVPPGRIYTGIVATWVVARGQEGPAAGWEADGEGTEEAGALGTLEVAALGGCHEGAQGLEAISGDEAAGDEVPEAALNVGGEAAAGAGDVVVEESAAGGEEVKDIAAGAGDRGGRRKRDGGRRWTRPFDSSLRFATRRLSANGTLIANPGQEPGKIAAADEGDRRGGGSRGGAAVVSAFSGCEAAPGDVAGHA